VFEDATRRMASRCDKDFWETLKRLGIGATILVKSETELNAIFTDSKSQWAVVAPRRLNNSTAARLRCAGQLGTLFECDASDNTVRVTIGGIKFWMTPEMLTIPNEVYLFGRLVVVLPGVCRSRVALLNFRHWQFQK
jgi:hypothetical protein